MRVARLLREHGLSEVAAEVMERLAGQLARRMVSVSGEVEFAATLDADTGEAIGTILRGEGREVDIRPHIRAFAAGRAYVSLHTHPGSTPFSFKDVLTLLTTPALRIVVVVGTDGTWYVTSRTPGRGTPDELAARRTIAEAYALLRPHYAAAAARGEMTRQHALDEMLHHLWTTVAPKIGLRYDRVRES